MGSDRCVDQHPRRRPARWGSPRRACLPSRYARQARQALKAAGRAIRRATIRPRSRCNRQRLQSTLLSSTPTRRHPRGAAALPPLLSCARAVFELAPVSRQPASAAALAGSWSAPHQPARAPAPRRAPPLHTSPRSPTRSARQAPCAPSAPWRSRASRAGRRWPTWWTVGGPAAARAARHGVCLSPAMHAPSCCSDRAPPSQLVFMPPVGLLAPHAATVSIITNDGRNIVVSVDTAAAQRLVAAASLRSRARLPTRACLPAWSPGAPPISAAAAAAAAAAGHPARLRPAHKPHPRRLPRACLLHHSESAQAGPRWSTSLLCTAVRAGVGQAPTRLPWRAARRAQWSRYRWAST